jgi:hypothetical protein
MPVAADASVLILLAKIRRLHLLKDLCGRVMIGPVVKAEVVDRGKAINARGVDLIEQAMTGNWLRLVRAPAPARAGRLLASSRLGAGEVEAISLADRRRLPLIADDKDARQVAEALGLTYLGTAGVLLAAYRARFLTLGEFETAVQDLAGVCWIAPEVIATILRLAREEQSK